MAHIRSLTDLRSEASLLNRYRIHEADVDIYIYIYASHVLKMMLLNCVLLNLTF